MAFAYTQRLDFALTNGSLLRLRTDPTGTPLVYHRPGQSYHLKIEGPGLVQKGKPVNAVIRAYSIASEPGAKDANGEYTETLITRVTSGGDGLADEGAFTLPLFMLAHHIKEPERFFAEIKPAMEKKFRDAGVSIPDYLECPKELLKLSFNPAPYGEHLVPLAYDDPMTRLYIGPNTGKAPFMSMLLDEYNHASLTGNHRSILIDGVPYHGPQAEVFKPELEKISGALNFSFLQAVSREGDGLIKIVQQYFLPTELNMDKKDVYALTKEEFAKLVLDHLAKGEDRSRLPIEETLGHRLDEKPLALYACGLVDMTDQFEALFSALPQANVIHVEGYGVRAKKEEPIKV